MNFKSITFLFLIVMIGLIIGLNTSGAGIDDEVIMEPEIERAIFDKIAPVEFTEKSKTFEADGINFEVILSKTADTTGVMSYIEKDTGDTVSITHSDIGWDTGEVINSGASKASAVYDGDNKIKYDNSLATGINTEIIINNFRIEKNIEIESLELLGTIPKDAKFLEISFVVDGAIDLPNGKITERIKFGDDSYIQPVRAWEDSGNDMSEATGVVSGNVITKRIPVEWLKSASYPVKTDLTITYGSESTYNPATTQWTSIGVLDDTHFVVAYQDLGNSLYGTARIGVYSGDSITSYGSESVFKASTTDYIFVKPVNNTHFIVSYRGDSLGKAIIGSVSGTTITFGSESIFNDGMTFYSAVDILDSTRFVVVYQDQADTNNGHAIIGVMSGTTITSWGTRKVIDYGAVSYVSVASLSSSSFVFAFTNTADSRGSIKACTVSGTTITSGGESIFNAAVSEWVSIGKIDNTHFVVAFKDNGNSEYGTAMIGTVSGTTVTGYGSEYVFNAGDTEHISLSTLDSETFVVAYRDIGGGDIGNGIIGSISGNEISYGDEYTFNSVYPRYISTSKIDENNFIISFKDEGGSDYGIAIIGGLPPPPVPPVITLISQTPSTINQNSTGTISMKYGIVHEASGLNNTSISFIYRNYDNDLGCSNHSIRPPNNDKAAVWDLNGRILRGQNRNGTLNFEDNDAITGGDIYSWSGLDENNTRLTIVPVNDTYTLVYINATIHDIMPSMWYLDRTELEESPKTKIAIHKTQDLLIKFWNIELFKGNTNYLGVGYTDTDLESNPALHPLDADPVEFYYISDGYDPATGGDPLTSGYAVFMGSLNATGWVDHVYSPHVNSSYVRGFIDNNLVESIINTTNISYVYFKSNTPSSKPYYINTSNVASGTNVSFADTKVLWSGGGSGTFTQLDYTPNAWFAFMKINMTFDHMLYVADNDDRWSNSTLNSTVITEGQFFPTRPVINHFHYPDNVTWDTDMDGMYNGIFDVGIAVGTDPDGGVVTMNVTLHYDNGTFVAIINNTVTSDDIVHNGVYADVEFNSSSYYSNEWNYTMKVVATDDEGYQSESWLGVNFTLSNRPLIDTFTPTTPVSSVEDDTQEFEISINQDSNVSWYLDGDLVFNETNVNTSGYNNSNANISVHNLTVYVENINGTSSQTWVWTVTVPLNFIPLQLFLMWIVAMLICFIGTAGGFYNEEHLVDGLVFSIIGLMIGFFLSTTIINAKLISVFGYVSSEDEIVIGRDVIQNSAMYWIFLFITIMFLGAMLYIISKLIIDHMKPVLEDEI